jgi:hypothetical protein
MSVFSKVIGATFVAGSMLAAFTPAAAAVTTFAQYSTVGLGANIMWKNNGTTSVNGTGGSIYTISSAASNVPGSHLTSFSFLQPSISPFVTNVPAAFTLNATVLASPTLLAGTFLIQQGISGTFSFKTTTALVVGVTTFAAGSNLLSGSFNQAAIVGARLSTSGSVSSATTSGATITYTSDFLSFVPTVDRDFAISLTSIASALQATPTNTNPTKALRTFKAVSTGSFSTDPAPLVTAVPEPAAWTLMIVGFGMVGLQTRRRTRSITLAA